MVKRSIVYGLGSLFAIFGGLIDFRNFMRGVIEFDRIAFPAEVIGILFMLLSLFYSDRFALLYRESQANHIPGTFKLLTALGADDVQLGDIEEEYLDTLDEFGIRVARRRFWKRWLLEVTPLLIQRITRLLFEAAKRA